MIRKNGECPRSETSGLLTQNAMPFRQLSGAFRDICGQLTANS